ncbi:MAG TPA: tRNA (adenosine(37)-N6)-threonylcarbamoyltransferase complex dimerization subunit type 1 TsaB [Planctomycetes bacterium]|nr:tRNA (adenosine(37)-N6)-threonylcarbamoyltransferase complex dimerization subunit type 1 TsaB [Planctomycetota bacterium]
MLIACEATDRSGSACAWNGAALDFTACSGSAEAQLVPLLDRLMRCHAPIASLAVAVGPGSFTGLRAATMAVRTLAWLEGLPVHPIDSLAACARRQGDGLWWVLLPLKRDTTFHALFRINGGHLETIVPTHACRDDQLPQLPELADTAVAIGPALSAKPGLAERWRPGVVCGDPSGPDARGVAALAGQVPSVAWDAVLPLYHQEPAPVLQRAAARETSVP